MARQPAPQSTRFTALSESDIRSQTDDRSYSRGRTYFRQSRIRDTVLRGNVIEANCRGSEPWPYRVSATLAPAGTNGANPVAYACSCPRGGFCKHVVALLLTWIDQPEQFTERPSIGEQLADRSPEELIALIERMIQRYPNLEQLVDLPMLVIPSLEEGVRANDVTIDGQKLRRHLRSSLASCEDIDRARGWDSWGGGVAVPDDVRSIVELGQRYVTAGQWANAQVVFEAVADEVLDILPSLRDESGEFSGVVVAADEGLAACLDAQAELPEEQRLSPQAREDLIRVIYETWQRDVFDVGGYDLSHHGVDALIRNATIEERVMVEGWLRAEDTSGSWQGEAVVGFTAALREVGGAPPEDILPLYQEAELWEDVANILVELDRVDEAAAVAGRHIRNPIELTRVANGFVAHGGSAVDRGLALVDDLLWEIEGTDAFGELALESWLMERYAALERPRDALKMAVRRFRHNPTLHLFHDVRRAAHLPGQAEGAWEEIRPGFIEQVRGRGMPMLVEVFLSEGDVVGALDAFEAIHDNQMEPGWYAPAYWIEQIGPRLAEAAAPQLPERAVTIWRNLAERMIDRRNRGSYQVAAGYLLQAKETLEGHDRQEAWQSLITDLRERHRTLRALREELDNLDLR